MIPFVWMLAGCAAFSRPAPVTDGESFFDRPWPDDRRASDGLPDLSDFPNRGEYDLLEEFLLVAEEIEGFATNGTTYLRFQRPLNTGWLPTPEESLRTDASVILVNVDPSSPRRGERVPIQWDRWAKLRAATSRTIGTSSRNPFSSGATTRSTNSLPC